MNKGKKYRYNAKTFEYEEIQEPKRWKVNLFRVVLVLFLSFGFHYLYSNVLGLEDPKTRMIRMRHDELCMSLDTLANELAQRRMLIEGMQIRDNKLYRPMFGMEELSEEIRNAGYGGVDRYSEYEGYYSTGLMKHVASEIDMLYSMAFIQSRSLDDIYELALRSDEMATAMPTISPVMTDGSCWYSSLYGTRVHPITGKKKTHDGVDIAGNMGTPIYATGDGVVERISYDMFGYGRYIMIDHGFGYKTRYGHLNTADVKVNQKVKKGDFIGTMGNTGRSTGPHLHYEIIYMGRTVNPLNYFNMKMDTVLYRYMVSGKGISYSDKA